MTDDRTGHQSLAVEARALLDVLADKLAAAARVPAGADPDTAPADATPPHPPRCTGCPLCAALNHLADHRELSAQLAQGALLVVGAVRQYLDHPFPPPSAPSSSSSPAPSPASVQRIDIT
ncbi:hypothetical protein [Nakamurella deserti]|uniref:hypothetical protein n=1 Tax=Nakamurella deserti TaxID=2164074 RepID=UPI000DBE0682|nr:hypothetical protein [Nakamurella deserti]